MFVLIGLKLGGVVHWSWWAVFAPVWVPALVLFAIGLPLAAMTLSSRIGDWRHDRRYQRLDRPPPWIGASSPDSPSS